MGKQVQDPITTTWIPVVDRFQEVGLNHLQPHQRAAGSGDAMDLSFIVLHLTSLKLPIVTVFLDCSCDDVLRAGARVRPRLGLLVTRHVSTQWQLSARMTAPAGYKIFRLSYRWLLLREMELLSEGVDITADLFAVRARAPPDPVTGVLEAPRG